MRYLIEVASLDEARVAEEAVVNFRKGMAPSTPTAAEESALAERVEAALASAPLNAQKATVIRTLLDAPEAEWVPFPTMIEAFISAGIGTTEDANHKASAALRDLSYQMRTCLPEADREGLEKAIEAFASRVRSGKVFSYRLTPAGRVAARRYMEGKPTGSSN